MFYTFRCIANVIFNQHWSVRTQSRSLVVKVVISTTLLAGFWSYASPALASDPTFDSRKPFGTGSDITHSIALGDLNGDGALDIATGNFGQNVIYWNNGMGDFMQSSFFGASSDVTYSIALGDLNGDGAIDIVNGNSGKNIINWNNGTGDFTQSTALGTASNWTSSVALGDLNGDGALDIVVGNYAGERNVIYWNNGVGDFTLSTPLGDTSDWTSSVALGDLNGDDALDIIVGNSSEGQNAVYWNDGAGDFTQYTFFGAGSDWTSSIAVGDLNGDGAFDIVAGDSGQSMIYWNDGTGDFTHFSILAAWAKSVAVGDLNSDNALDIVVGDFGQNAVYWNDGGGVFTQSTSFGIAADSPDSVAVGDLNGDGGLDIVVGNGNQQNAIYSNNRPVNFTTSTSFGTAVNKISSVAVGDLNGDGPLDIVAGSPGQNTVYWNNGAGSFTQSMNFGASSDATYGIALGDLDSNGTLDIVVGNERQQNAIYWNHNGDGSTTFAPLGSSSDWTACITVGDLNGDGSLDIVVGNYTGQQNIIYWNDGTGDFSQFSPLGTGLDWTSAIALGDLNGDGELDIVVGNDVGGQNIIYWNGGGTGDFTQSSLLGSGSDWTTSVAIGDLNDDGALDIVVGNDGQQNVVYWNDGGGDFTQSSPFGTGSDPTQSIALGDLNGDGTLDIVTATYIGDIGEQNAVYWNMGKGNFATTSPIGDGSDQTYSIALGDLNGDGTLDIISGNDGGVQKSIYWNYTGISSGSVNNQPFPAVQRPTKTRNADFYSSPEILTNSVIPISYTLFDTERDPVGYITAQYSLNSGGQWFPAISITGSITTSLGTAPYPTVNAANTHVFYWDTFSSGLFGRYDNVIFRIESYAQPPYTGIAGSYHYTNGVPGPYLWPHTAATTFPFRVRGTQVRVFRENATPGNQITNALLYRLPQGPTSGGLLIANKEGEPLRTNAQGYLQGRGEIHPGDRLLALSPIRSEGKYTLYHTSAAPTDIGLDAFTITQSGVQTLTVSAANPLILFDLTVALEWDATNDPIFLTQLEQNLSKASAALYDWTNGQVALGQVTVYQAKEQWDNADIRIYASNQVRPVANRGGVVTEPLVLTDPRLTEPITATSGEVRIGATWNRYGDLEPIGDDWPNVLAHELGHYLLFLEDSYLGVDAASGLLGPVTTCQQTAMSDPYDVESSELRYADSAWQEECAASLAELPDWELLTLAYPELHRPPPTNLGPVTMPFAFTQVTIQPAPTSNAPLLSDQEIALGDAGAQVGEGRAYLLKSGRLVDLGRPVINGVQARGAQEGDELCVFGRAAFTCSQLSNQHIASFSPQPLWQPDLTVTPINTTTVRIWVDDGSANPIQATFYPNGEAPSTVALTPGVTQTVTLSQPAVEAWIHLAGDAAAKQLITGYSIGDGPGRIKSHGGPGRIKSHGGSITNGDGAIVLYPPPALPENVFFSVQTASAMPAPPPDRMPIGRAYQIQASDSTVDFTGASLTFQYLGMDVILAGQPEAGVTIYYWNGANWQELTTILNQTQNFASAPLVGPGLYTLMSSYKIPLATIGWNQIGYPINETRPVTVALASIEGAYTTVYGYDATDGDDPWKVYAVDVPAWVNDLHEMHFGAGYWIYATSVVTWYIEGVPLNAAAASLLPTPPATYYGAVLPTSTFTPTAGMVVTATINGQLCGRGQTRAVADQIVYVINVPATSGGSGHDCGQPGQPVTFAVDNHAVALTAEWENERLYELSLTVAEELTPHALYLPVMAR